MTLVRIRDSDLISSLIVARIWIELGIQTWFLVWARFTTWFRFWFRGSDSIYGTDWN